MANRRKVILPVWSGNTAPTNINDINKIFEDFGKGELLLNISSDETSVIIVDNNDNLEKLVSKTYLDSIVEDCNVNITNVSGYVVNQFEHINNIITSAITSAIGYTDIKAKDLLDEVDGRVTTVADNLTTLSGEVKTLKEVSLDSEAIINSAVTTASAITSSAVSEVDGRVTTVAGNLTTLSGAVEGLMEEFDSYATSADVMTTNTITAVGGVWAEDVKKVFGNTIPSGLTFVDFLKKMVFIEKFATNVNCETILDVTCAAPGAGINLTNNQNYEVGTKVILYKVTVKDTNVTHNIKTTGLEYGYKIGKNGEYISATTYTQSLAPKLIDENTRLTASFTGFTNILGASISTVFGTTELNFEEFYVGSGTNKVVITQSGKTYSSNTTASTNSVYVATNMGNYYKENSADLNIFNPKVDIKTAMANASSTYTVNGYRNTYYGTTEGGEELTPSFIKSDKLKKTGKTIESGDTITLTTNKEDKHFRMIIASPREIYSVTDDMVQQNITGDLEKNMRTESIPGANGYQSIDYYVYDYTWVAAFDNKKWIITFK